MSEDEAASRTNRRPRRKNYCPYCERLISNFSRHLVSQHPDEDDVRAYVALKNESPKKRKRLRTAVTDRLRNRGNRMYNAKIVEDQRDDPLLPSRLPSKGERAVNNVTHVSCKHCYGLFKRELLFRHLTNCSVYNRPKNNSSGGDGGGRNDDDEQEEGTNGEDGALSPASSGKRIVLAQHAEQVMKIHDNASDVLKTEVFPRMQKDALTVAAQSDGLICKFGSEFRMTHRGLKQISYCSSRLRSLARILLEMKNARPDSIKEFSDCISPRHFDLLVQAVRKICQYDEKKSTMKTPSITPRLCSSLKRCANILKSEAIKSEMLNREATTDVVYRLNNFLHLMEKDWGTQVGAVSEISRRRQKVVKKDLLPDPDDIRKFNRYIHELCPKYVSDLQAVPTTKNYERLAKLIIVHIITLNRRRPNETVEITTEEYRSTLEKRTDYGDDDSQNVVTAEEIEATKDLVIFYVAANKNLKKVPVLLTKVFHRALETLLASQEKVGVRSKYVFGRPNSAELFDGSMVLREIAGKANLNSPAVFTANALRHHAATSSQLQSRDDTYTKRLSKFMGHDLRTHEHFYEMPLPFVQKAKVGHKLLQMVLPKKTAPTCTITSQSACTSPTLESDVTSLSTTGTFSPRPDPISPTTTRLSDADTLPPFAHLPSTSGAKGTDKRQKWIQPTATAGKEEEISLNALSTPSTSHSEEAMQPLPATPNRSSNVTPKGSVVHKTPPPPPSGDRCTDSSPGANTSSSVSSNTPPRKVFRKRRWTMTEKRVVYEKFGQQFLMGMKPSRCEIMLFWENEPVLKGRTLEQTVTYVNNIVNGKHHIPTPTRRKIKHMVGKKRKHLSP